jgi:hypothetical protein
MAKKTLLQMTQDVLSAIDGDEVNSITDTTEAEQVARIIGRVYDNYVVNTDIPEEHTLFVLDAFGDTNRPTHMQVPSTIDNVDWIKYNIRKSTDTKDRFVEIPEVSQEEFINRIHSRNSSDLDVQTVTENSATLYIKNDKAPEYYCLFDDNIVIFDSFDSTVDATLQQSKTTAYGQKSTQFSLTDSFVINLDANLHPLILNDAISTSFIELKQSANQKAEGEARRQRIKSQNNRYKTGPRNDWVNFGRK